MPPSVLPPFVIRFDAANVPIGYLVLESKTRPLGELADLGLFRIRPMLIAKCRARCRFRRTAATPARSSSRSTPTASAPTTSRPKTWCGLGERQRRRAVGQSVYPRADAAGADQRHGGRSAGDGQHSHSSRARTSTSATWPRFRTPRTSTMAARWSTAASRSTSRW